MRGLSIALLGEPQVSFDGVPVVCTSKKALGLFIYLALHSGRQPRRHLARLFWGGADEAAARTSLRSALQRLPAPLAGCLTVDREIIGLSTAVELDTARFAALAGAEDVESLAEASQLYGGELLKNLDIDAAPEYDDWLNRERTGYRQLAQSVFDRLITRHRERAHSDTARASTEREAAMAAARRWSMVDPAAEGAHRWLMQLFFDAGQRDAALSQYEVCQRELAVASGRGPNAQTRALFESIAAGAGLSVAAARARAHSIEPAVRAPEIAATSFVGRGDELAALEQLLNDPACRLLTLHALGGMGKSRLAFALAHQVASRFALGATWIALGPLQSADHLPHAVARALGLELAAQAEPSGALCAALRAQERLLVLDNFEHLISDGAIDLVLSILREAPRVRLLVTSREVLGVQEEWVFEVPGMAFPLPDRAQAAALGEYPAVELFVQRARQAYVGFSARAEWPHVVRICRLVEGLPLALELAAAWVRTIPCGDLAHAIETEMASLATRHRNRPARQHSLDAVVRTSWSLLTREQQQALVPLSLFVGGFTQEAAHAVADVSLRIMSSLADKSLVSRRADGRLDLHALVRQFARGQLARREQAALLARRRFAAFYSTLLGRCRARLDGPEELEAEAMLSDELPNILSAIESWSGDGIGIDMIAEPICRALLGRGWFRQVRTQADRFLSAAPPATPATQALVLALRGRANASLRDVPASQADFDAAIALARIHGLRYPLAYASIHSVVVPFINDQLDLAQRRLADAQPLVVEVGDASLGIRAHQITGMLLDAMGSAAAAAQSLREAVQLARRVGSPTLLAAMLTSLGGPLIKLGRFEEGEAALREAIPLLERTGSSNLARALNTLAVLVLWRSNGAEAAETARLATRSIELFERMGFESGQSAAGDTLGQALQALGRVDDARAQFERAAAIGGPIVEAEAKFHLALLELEQGHLREAQRLAIEHLDAARQHELPVAFRCAVLLAASLAAHAQPPAIAARRWLHALLADPELDFDLRRRTQALLASLPGPAMPASDPPKVGDLLSELEQFLH